MPPPAPGLPPKPDLRPASVGPRVCTGTSYHPAAILRYLFPSPSHLTHRLLPIQSPTTATAHPVPASGTTVIFASATFPVTPAAM